MNLGRLCVIGITLLLLVAPATAQHGQECQERFDALEQEANQALEEANSTEEQREIRERYSERFQELEEECEHERNETNETYETTAPPDPEVRDRPTMAEEECRARASELKESFIANIEGASIMAMDQDIERFLEERAGLRARCPVFGTDRTSQDDRRGGSTDSESGQESIELDFSLPERLPDDCREEIETMREEYLERMEQNPDERSSLREEFYTRVEEQIRSCESGMRIVNVSEAPEMVDASCKESMRELNQEIIASTNASVGDQVPDKYRDRYQSQIRSCMTGAITERVQSGILQRAREAASGLLGESNATADQAMNATSLQDRLQQKNKRIRQLEARVAELEAQLGDDGETDTPDQDGGQDRPDERRQPPSAPHDEGETGQDSQQDTGQPDRETGPNTTDEQDDQRSGTPGSGIIKAITSIFS